MKFKILWMAICVLTIITPTYGATDHCLDHKAVLFVESGDSYIKLFGNDWLRVFKANNTMAFYDKHGKLTCTPDKLVVGTQLIIPKNTHITEVVARRFSHYENIRKDALQAIHMADSLINQGLANSSDVYRQGVNLLKQAKQIARGVTFEFQNYLKANKMAEEAIRCFKIDQELRSANQNMRRLNNKIEREQFFLQQQIRIFNQQRTTLAGSLIALFISIFWFIKYRKTKERKERIVRIEEWLGQHLTRVNALENAKI